MKSAFLYRVLSEGELYRAVSKPVGSLPTIKVPSRLPDW